VPLTVLTVAYPLAPVGPDVSGGAEQVAAAIDRALVAGGHRSIVVASADSEICGVHIATPVAAGALTPGVRSAAQARHRRAVDDAIDRYPIDVVHLHGVDFDRYLPDRPIPTVVTLHLPWVWYSPQGRRAAAERLHLVCVSRAQQRTWGLPGLLVIENGVGVDRFAPARRRNFVLTLGRICGEKAPHLAVEAAAAAGVPIAVAGALFPYPEHQRYFDDVLAPRLCRGRAAYLGPIGLARKRRLLGAARAVLIPSIAPETSSLVAMEAMASGTPVVAFRQGALPDLVQHGRTGFIVDTVDEMAAAIANVDALDRAAIRRHAVDSFAAERMVAQYFELYRQLARHAAPDHALTRAAR